MRRFSSLALIGAAILFGAAAPAQPTLRQAQPKGLPQVKPLHRPPFIASVKKVGAPAYVNASPLTPHR